MCLYVLIYLYPHTRTQTYYVYKDLRQLFKIFVTVRSSLLALIVDLESRFILRYYFAWFGGTSYSIKVLTPSLQVLLSHFGECHGFLFFHEFFLAPYSFPTSLDGLSGGYPVSALLNSWFYIVL